MNPVAKSLTKISGGPKDALSVRAKQLNRTSPLADART
jgi:hypothetical protein